jgi:23S rRNA (cytidine1920-2'-O)/16S rRNA (cytidine1409-2'-O)-methyltransferase
VARRRLDAELVRRGLVASREQARSAIEASRVSVAGVTATKAATQVEESAAIEIDAAGKEYVSRGAHKLIGALDAFELDVAGTNALDAGASTGGFTQVLLERGAGQVMAVDVGYGQLAWSLRNDPRVVVRERVNVRQLSIEDLPTRPDLVVADLSFISLTKVLPALVGVAAPGASFLVMVKPQFEVGRDRVGSGVVTDPAVRIEAVAQVASAARELGLAVHGVSASPLPGPKGNVEYFLWMSTSGSDASREPGDDGGMDEREVAAAIERAVQEGPA